MSTRGWDRCNVRRLPAVLRSASRTPRMEESLVSLVTDVLPRPDAIRRSGDPVAPSQATMRSPSRRFGRPVDTWRLHIRGQLCGGLQTSDCAATDEPDGHTDEQDRQREQPAPFNPLESPEPGGRLVAGPERKTVLGQALKRIP